MTYKPLTDLQVIKQMDNRHLIETINKIRKEKENPAVYGKNGSSRWVTSSEFWSGHHQDLKAELQRRKNAGLIKENAGQSKVKNQINKKRSLAPSFNDLMRM
jgi:hypothetical protein